MPPRRTGSKKAECEPSLTLPLKTPSAVCGIWANEDQELAGLGFGFRALTRTPVAFRDALSNVASIVTFLPSPCIWLDCF